MRKITNTVAKYATDARVQLHPEDKHRWDIEKIFHQFKSKMGERESWASSHDAKQSHAIFECLAHNLLLLFEPCLGQNEGLRNTSPHFRSKLSIPVGRQ